MVAVIVDEVPNKGSSNEFNQWPGFFCMGDRGGVVVYANDFQDAVLVRDVLESCGYELRAPLRELAEPAQADNFGAIVCHRAGEDVAAAHLLRIIRASRVVVLSDCHDEQTVVTLLNSGAHHFFDVDEPKTVVKMRVMASLRVHNTRPAQFFTINDITFDTHRRKVFRADRQIDLSPKEYELALYLFSNVDRVVRNDELMSAVWSLPSHMDTRRIDTAACRVRKKLGLAPALGWELKRIRMVGYRLLQTSSMGPVCQCG